MPSTGSSCKTDAVPGVDLACFDGGFAMSRTNHPMPFEGAAWLAGLGEGAPWTGLGLAKAKLSPHAAAIAEARAKRLAVRAEKGKPKRRTVRAVYEAGNVSPDEEPATADAVTEARSTQPQYEGDDEPGPTDPIEALRRRLARGKRTRKSNTTMTKITKQQALDQDVGAVVKAAQIHYERGWTDLDPSAPLPSVEKAEATGDAVAPVLVAARASDPGRITKATTGGTTFGAVVADLRAKGRA